MNGYNVPVATLADVCPASGLAQVPHSQPFAPHVIERTTHASGALDHYVLVWSTGGVDCKRCVSLAIYVAGLLSLAECTYDKFQTIILVPDWRDMRAATGPHRRQRRDVGTMEEFDDIGSQACQ